MYGGVLLSDLAGRFLRDETGAVTVDWVVLTAAIVGIAISVLIIISGGIQSTSEYISCMLNKSTVVQGDLNTGTFITCSGIIGSS